MEQLLRDIKRLICMSMTKRELICDFEKLLEKNKELLKENGIEL